MPVKTETFVNSTDVNISIRSENNFWMLLIKLASMLTLHEKSTGLVMINCDGIKCCERKNEADIKWEQGH